MNIQESAPMNIQESEQANIQEFEPMNIQESEQMNTQESQSSNSQPRTSNIEVCTVCQKVNALPTSQISWPTTESPLDLKLRAGQFLEPGRTVITI